ncbi:TRAP transporter small permease [Sneathiella aquimaris]|uniref:TRAP transporter small permease n=1 Tax=Sneathiella aquimaris TaxID=2599305 RepID=UPI00146CB80F|nr:TRAP transporter small permease [Sneathiella aquimaris]
MAYAMKIIKKIEHFLMATLATISLILAVWEMFMRYYFPSSLPDWTSEVVIYLITASVMLSGGLLVSENRHVHADFFLRMIPANQQRYMEIAFCLLGMGVCYIIMERGFGIVDFAYRLDERSDSSLQFPVYLYYAFVPAAFGLMLLHYTHRLFSYIFTFDIATMTTTEVDLENAD